MRAINRRQALGMTAAAASSTLFSPVYAQSLNKPKIAFALLWPEGGEFGWSYEHVRALEQAREFYGDRVQIDTFFDVPEWGNGEKEIFQKMASDDYGLVFATSGGFIKATVEVSQEFPDVKFESCTGYVRAGNLATYGIRWYEGRTVEGFLAGAMSKTGRVGYLASFPVPEVIRGINSAYMAARSVNPDVKFDIVWLNTWGDAAIEGEAARQLLDRGADVLIQHTSSAEPMKVAQQRGAYAFGQGSDMSAYGPDAVLTSIVNNWAPYYIRRIGEFLDGTWTPTETWGGLGEDMVTMAPLLESLPNRIVLQTQDIIARLSSGEQHAFIGPMRKQDGSGWLAPGETASDSDLLTMDYYADGITSVFPS